VEPVDFSRELERLGMDAGLAAVGVARVGSWGFSRGVLEERRAEGISGSMQFTYRNPARSTEPARILPGATSMVVGAWRYASGADLPPPRRLGRSARVARYASGDTNAALRRALDVVADGLRVAGHRAVVVSDDNALVDREAAFRAGLGFYGKNANLLLRDGGGSWVVLGAVVTTADLAPLQPPAGGECGTCRRCLDACPTGAIVAPGVVDARRCLSWVLQEPGSIPEVFREAIGDRVYGCDDCQEVCPPTRRAAGEVLDAPVGPGGWVDAPRWLDLDDAAMLSAAGRWYVAGHDAGILRRNLLVVLGNVGSPDDPDVRRAVSSHLTHPDPVVAEHARWAATRLGLDVDGAEMAAAGPPDEDGAS
jgi:epoxyqueuosine reductase